MSGQKLNELIRLIINKRSNGNAFLESITKAKMIMKGIDADKKYTTDDQILIDKLMLLAKDLKIDI